MNSFKITGNKGENTIKILGEVLGSAYTDSIPTESVVKSASVKDTKKEYDDMINQLSNSKSVVKCANTHKGSVIDISDKLMKSAEKEFMTDTTSYLYKMCSVFGIKGAQLTAYNMKLDDISITGLRQNIPHTKEGSAFYKIKCSSLGMNNIGYIKISMKDNKIIDPKYIYLNKKDKYSFTDEGVQEFLKACHAPKNYDNEDLNSKTFITVEYKDVPGLGVQGVERSLGKYANYYELGDRLTKAGYLVSPVKGDFNTYEVFPFDNKSVDDMLNIIKENGKVADDTAFMSKGNEATEEAKGTKIKGEASVPVKDAKPEGNSETNFGGKQKDAATTLVSEGKNTAAKDNTETDEVTNGKETEKKSKEPKETEDEFGTSQKDNEFLDRPDTGGKAKSGGENGDGGEAAKMMQEGSNKPAKANTKGDAENSSTNNGKTTEDTSAEPKETENDFGDSQTDDEFYSRDHKTSGDGKSGPGDNSKPADTPTSKEACSGLTFVPKKKGKTGPGDNSKEPDTPLSKEAYGGGVPGTAREEARTNKAKTKMYDDGVKPETQAKNQFEKNLNKSTPCVKNSARLAAIAKYKEAALNVGTEVDAQRTKDKDTTTDVTNFFNSWHYLDEGADKFGISRGEIAKYLANSINRGYKVNVKSEGMSDEEANAMYTRNIIDVMGKIKLTKRDGKIPENENTKSAGKHGKEVGAVLGGAAGGAIGARVGGVEGAAKGTALGATGGGLVGDKAEDFIDEKIKGKKKVNEAPDEIKSAGLVGKGVGGGLGGAGGSVIGGTIGGVPGAIVGGIAGNIAGATVGDDIEEAEAAKKKKIVPPAKSAQVVGNNNISALNNTVQTPGNNDTLPSLGNNPNQSANSTQQTTNTKVVQKGTEAQTIADLKTQGIATVSVTNNPDGTITLSW
jgi:outer membrane lipoprotein SlyB